jgi:hypothetical protein
MGLETRQIAFLCEKRSRHNKTELNTPWLTTIKPVSQITMDMFPLSYSKFGRSFLFYDISMAFLEIRWRTDNTMTKRQRIKGQTKIYKTSWKEAKSITLQTICSNVSGLVYVIISNISYTVDITPWLTTIKPVSQITMDMFPLSS